MAALALEAAARAGAQLHGTNPLTKYDNPNQRTNPPARGAAPTGIEHVFLPFQPRRRGRRGPVVTTPEPPMVLFAPALTLASASAGEPTGTPTELLSEFTLAAMPLHHPSTRVSLNSHLTPSPGFSTKPPAPAEHTPPHPHTLAPTSPPHHTSQTTTHTAPIPNLQASLATAHTQSRELTQDDIVNNLTPPPSPHTHTHAHTCTGSGVHLTGRSGVASQDPDERRVTLQEQEMHQNARYVDIPTQEEQAQHAQDGDSDEATAASATSTCPQKWRQRRRPPAEGARRRKQPRPRVRSSI